MQKSKLLDGYLIDADTRFYYTHDLDDPAKPAKMTLIIECTNRDAKDAYQFFDEYGGLEDKRGFPIQINGVVESAEGRLDIDMVTKQGLKARAVDVTFNDPATIVFWSDHTKTVVKCQEGDTYSPEAGLAMCYMKKALGNSSRAFNDALKPAKDKEWELDPSVRNYIELDATSMVNLMHSIRKTYGKKEKK